MSQIREFLGWFRGLFRRPVELLEFFSATGTIIWVLLAYRWHQREAVLPSLSLLSALMSEMWWFALATASALLQLAALAAEAWYWRRFAAAGLVGGWYAILLCASATQQGGPPNLAMYGVMLGMNAYICLHVLDGRRR